MDEKQSPEQPHIQKLPTDVLQHMVNYLTLRETVFWRRSCFFFVRLRHCWPRSIALDFSFGIFSASIPVDSALFANYEVRVKDRLSQVFQFVLQITNLDITMAHWSHALLDHVTSLTRTNQPQHLTLKWKHEVIYTAKTHPFLTKYEKWCASTTTLKSISVPQYVRSIGFQAGQIQVLRQYKCTDIWLEWHHDLLKSLSLLPWTYLKRLTMSVTAELIIPVSQALSSITLEELKLILYQGHSAATRNTDVETPQCSLAPLALIPTKCLILRCTHKFIPGWMFFVIDDTFLMNLAVVKDSLLHSLHLIGNIFLNGLTKGGPTTTIRDLSMTLPNFGCDALWTFLKSCPHLTDCTLNVWTSQYADAFPESPDSKQVELPIDCWEELHMVLNASGLTQLINLNHDWFPVSSWKSWNAWPNRTLTYDYYHTKEEEDQPELHRTDLQNFKSERFDAATLMWLTTKPWTQLHCLLLEYPAWSNDLLYPLRRLQTVRVITLRGTKTWTPLDLSPLFDLLCLHNISIHIQNIQPEDIHTISSKDWKTRLTVVEYAPEHEKMTTPLLQAVSMWKTDKLILNGALDFGPGGCNWLPISKLQCRTLELRNLELSKSNPPLTTVEVQHLEGLCLAARSAYYDEA